MAARSRCFTGRYCSNSSWFSTPSARPSALSPSSISFFASPHDRFVKLFLHAPLRRFLLHNASPLSFDLFSSILRVCLSCCSSDRRHTSRTSVCRVEYTRRGTEDIFFHFHLFPAIFALSINATSPSWRSPSVFSSSSFLHHGSTAIICKSLLSNLFGAVVLKTELVSHTVFLFPHDDLASRGVLNAQVHAVHPHARRFSEWCSNSKYALCERDSLHFCRLHLQSLVRRLPMSADFKPRPEESSPVGNPRAYRVRYVYLNESFFLDIVSDRPDHHLHRLNRGPDDPIALRASNSNGAVLDDDPQSTWHCLHHAPRFDQARQRCLVV